MTRRFLASFAASFCLVFVPAFSTAQPFQERSARPRPVQVVFEDATMAEGLLVEMEREAVTLEIDGERQRFALDDIVRIDEERDDSLINGAIIGGMIAGAWCAAVCGQGLDDRTALPAAIAINAALGAFAGAGVDMLITTHATVYPRPDAPRRSRAGVIGVRFRF